MKAFDYARWTVCWGILALGCSGLARAEAPEEYVLGQWEFDGDLSAATGQEIEYLGDTEELTEFTMREINGEEAQVMRFPAATPEQGYEVFHGAPPNGGGTRVNHYTLIMDVMYPTGSETWRALFRNSDLSEPDAEMFISPWGAIGINVQYDPPEGVIRSEVWHRVALAFDLTNNIVAKYVDGRLIAEQTLDAGGDGRWALEESFQLFTDDNSETAPGYINSLQFRDYTMSADEIAALGSASAAGITSPGTPPVGTGFNLSIARSGPNVIISVDEAGTFQLEKKPALGQGDWTPVGDPSSTGEFTLPVNDEIAFFRARRL